MATTFYLPGTSEPHDRSNSTVSLPAEDLSAERLVAAGFNRRRHCSSRLPPGYRKTEAFTARDQEAHSIRQTFTRTMRNSYMGRPGEAGYRQVYTGYLSVVRHMFRLLACLAGSSHRYI